MKIWLPTDRSRRVLLVALVCSVALHALLAASVYLAGALGPTIIVKRGEPLFVDIAPDRPEEPAPRGNPARPVGPEQAPPARRAQEPPVPKAREARPRVAEAPKPAPVPASPQQQVAKASPAPPPETPAPRAPEPAPVPGPQARAPERESPAPPTQPTESTPSEGRPGAARPAPASEPGGQMLAKTRAGLDLPAAMLRRPGGGGGLRDGHGGVEGEPVPLDTQDPKYVDYFGKLRERIKSKWIYPREAGERGIGGQLLIEFHIAKDGHLQLLELRRSSGVEILDEYAMNAVRLAQPFPPVPDILGQKGLPVSGLFSYQIVGNSFVNQFLR
ncbi:MAG: TonB family protein [Candidatus Rokubacteria bacterium]|nr:TonB family protein [Candidatus Rokubacteria bacterium]